MRPALLTSLLLTALATLALSHGDDPAAEKQEQLERRRFLEIHTNNLNHCADKLARSGLLAEAAQRRYKRAASLMTPSALHAAVQARQATVYLGKSHKSDKAYTAQTDPAVVFADSNSCVLSPQATEGPFCELLYLSNPLSAVCDWR
jgi:hypothetical protein